MSSQITHLKIVKNNRNIGTFDTNETHARRSTER